MMKINGVNGANLNPYQKQMQKQQQLQSSQPKDKLEISNEAKQLQEGNGIVQARKEKVENLKQQVKSNEYDVNPKKTAEKMIDFWANKRV